jgi:hypothetical protein
MGLEPTTFCWQPAPTRPHWSSSRICERAQGPAGLVTYGHVWVLGVDLIKLRHESIKPSAGGSCSRAVDDRLGGRVLLDGQVRSPLALGWRSARRPHSLHVGGGGASGTTPGSYPGRRQPWRRRGTRPTAERPVGRDGDRAAALVRVTTLVTGDRKPFWCGRRDCRISRRF